MLNAHFSDVAMVKRLLWILLILLTVMVGAVAVFEWQDARRQPELYGTAPK